MLCPPEAPHFASQGTFYKFSRGLSCRDQLYDIPLERTVTTYACYTSPELLYLLGLHEEHFSKLAHVPSCNILLERSLTIYSCYEPPLALVLFSPTGSIFINFVDTSHVTYHWKGLWPFMYVIYLRRIYPISSGIILKIFKKGVEFELLSFFFASAGSNMCVLSNL